MQNKLMSLLGIARRAGKLALGNDVVIDCILTGQSKLVLLAVDISTRTSKNVENVAQEGKVEVKKLTETMHEVGVAIGKRTGIISVNDKGFADKICTLIDD